MDFNDIQKLRAFFAGIKENGFKKIPSFATVDGQRTPIDKAHCLQLLRQLPQFQEEQFKDENAILEYLRDPNKRNFLLGEFKEGRVELTEALTEKPVTTTVVTEQPAATAEAPLPAGEPAGTMSNTAGFGLPMTGGSTGISPQRRVIRRAPRAPEPTPGSTTSSGASAKVTVTTPASSITTTSSGLSGNITFNLSPKAAETAETTQPGKGIKGTGRRMQTPKIPTVVRSIGSTIGSKTGIFLKRNILGIARTGLGAFAGGALTGGNPLGILGGGIGGATFKAWGAKVGNGLVNAGIGISNQVSRGSLVKLQGRKAAFGLILLLVIPVLLATAFSGIPGGGSTTGGIPTTGGGGLDYTIPLRDPSVTPLDIRDRIRAEFRGAKIEYWDRIIQRARSASINPAVALALWIEETGASHTTLIRNGGSEIPVRGQLSRGHLGCAPLEDQTIDESLTCLINFVNRNNFTNDQFAQFMARYSSGPPENPFANNPDFPGNFRSWYSRLVSSGPGALVAITPTPGGTYTPGGGSGLISCPVNGGRITTGSISTPGGHCSQSYLAQGLRCVLPGQPNYTGRDTAVDVQGSDRNVFLPNLGGSSVIWTVDETGTEISDNDGGGVAVGANASYNGHNYRIRFIHLESTSLQRGQTAPSSTLVGQHLIPTRERPRLANHVHLTLQEDGVYKPADLYFQLCQ